MRLVRRPGHAWKEAASAALKATRTAAPQDKWTTLLKQLKESKSCNNNDSQQSPSSHLQHLTHSESISAIDDAKEDKEFQIYIWRLTAFTGVLIFCLAMLALYKILSAMLLTNRLEHLYNSAATLGA